MKTAKATILLKSAHLAQAGGEVLIVAGYLDQGGKGVIQACSGLRCISTPSYLPDGMVGDSLPAAIGAGLNGSYGANPGTDSPGAASFQDMAKAAGFDGTSAFAAESYDAAALIMLAMAGCWFCQNSADFKAKVMEVANAPGEKIFPGELVKALELIKAGTDIDYVGASAVELIGPGESAGNYREIEVKDGKIVAVKYR